MPAQLLRMLIDLSKGQIEKLIELKEQLGQERDLAALPSLREALRERRSTL